MLKRTKKVVWSATAVVVLIVGLLGVFVLPRLLEDKETFDSSKPTKGITDTLHRDVPDDLPDPRFIEASSRLGIDFHHEVAPRGSLLVEDMGPGVAIADFNGDGLPDIYCVNGAVVGGTGGANRMFYQQEGGTFNDATDSSRTGSSANGMGVAVGDVDGDGDLDLYITNHGPNVLFLNDGKGVFVDDTAASGTGCELFGVGAQFGDVDSDGDLDLYVTNYLDFTNDERAVSASLQYGQGVPFTLNPSSYDPVPNRLYINDGKGRFADRARVLGVEDAADRSMGVTICDFDEDGVPEIYVANDISSNRLYIRNGDGTYTERSAQTLTSDYKGAMGMAVGDFDRDGDQDLFITHWLAQENTLFRNGGAAKDELFFEDVSHLFGLGAVALPDVGWGTHFFDYDNDGLLDLAVMNGNTQQDKKGRLVPQNNRFFWNAGERGFFEVADVVCAEFAAPNVARGSAVGDIDNDGDLDLVVARNRGKLGVFINEGGNAQAWLGISLRDDSGGNRFGVGARLVARDGNGGLLASVQVGVSPSYLSQDQLRVHIGLGKLDSVASLLVQWPDGTHQELRNVPTRQHLVVTKEVR